MTRTIDIRIIVVNDEEPGGLAKVEWMVTPEFEHGIPSSAAAILQQIMGLYEKVSIQ